MSKLLAYILPSGIAGVEVTSWSKEDIGSAMPFLFSDSILDGYEDISSILNWGAFGGHSGLDYLQIYKELSTEAYYKILGDWSNFDNLTEEEKGVVCRFCIPPMAYRLQVVTQEQDAANWTDLVQKTRLSRIKIVEKMRECVSEYQNNGQLSKQESDDFYKDTKDLLLAYEFTNNNEFKQWLTSEQGSQYEFTGYASKPYYLPEIKEKLVYIIIDLNY